MHIYIPAWCAYPSGIASNVTVEEYNSIALEGSQITYHCQPGLVPSEWMVANCTESGYWIPDPAELICEGLGAFKLTIP